MTKTSDARAILDEMVGEDDDMRRLIARETLNIRVAEEIHSLRIKAGLTQSELARRAGMGRTSIARLEDADYRGHSLGSLVRIAAALGKQVEISFSNPSGPPVRAR